MINRGHTYPIESKFTFEQKLFFLREQNLPFFIEKIYSPLITSNVLIKGSGRNKELNEVKVKEFRSAFGQLFKYLLDLRKLITEKYGEKSQEFENIYTLLNGIIEINQQLPKMTCERVVKKSFFRKQSDLTPALTVKNNVMRTVKLYETVLRTFSL